MKILYLECNMGAAGDMLMAALTELLPEPDSFIRKINNIGLPGVSVSLEHVEKRGICGSSIHVKINGEEEHEHTSHHAHSHSHGRTMQDITHIIRHLDVPDNVKSDISEVYRLIADAESQAHGAPVEQIHFHEVGAMDALADITGVCLLMDWLKPERILSSAITTGFGEVHCAHGILPVPAPATASLLTGIPTRRGSIEGELCTPTGAALIRHFVQEFDESPVLTIEKTGYGMGKKNFEALNCIRAFCATTNGSATGLSELSCNLDDMTPEAIGYATQLLLSRGALDVFTTPIQMKKDRPAILLTCLCPAEDANTFIQLMLEHTTTAGVREKICKRHMLAPAFVTVETTYGNIKVKVYTGNGIEKFKPEYDDVSAAAQKHGAAFDNVSAAACAAYRSQKAKQP